MRAIFAHSIRLYDELEQRAVEEDGLVVFRGHPTTIVTEELGFPSPYYSQIRSILLTIGSVKQIKRGSAKSLSEWILVRRPTAQDFEGVEPNPERADDKFVLYKLATDAEIARLGGIIDQLQGEVRSMKQTIEELQRERTAHAV